MSSEQLNSLALMYASSAFEVDNFVSDNERKPKSIIHSIAEADKKLLQIENEERHIHNKIIVSDAEESTEAQLLQTIFDLPETSAFHGEFTCWLVESILVKGTIFISSGYLCFYASLGNDDEVSIREGVLQKKTDRKMYASHNPRYVILTNTHLSFYNSQAEIYNPRGTIDLRTVKFVRASKSNDCRFQVHTHKKKYVLTAATPQIQAEWIKDITLNVFRSKNTKKVLKIVLPYENIIETNIVRSDIFGDSLIFKVTSDNHLDQHNRESIQEYCFSYLSNSSKVFDIIRMLKKEKAMKNENNDVRGRLSLSSTKENNSNDSLTLAKKSLDNLSTTKENNTTFKVEIIKNTNKTHVQSIQSPGVISTRDLALDIPLPETEKKIEFQSKSIYVHGVVPKFGRIFVTNGFVTFQSQTTGARANALLPLDDVIGVHKRSSSLLLYGVRILMRDQTNFSFDFYTSGPRDEFIFILCQKIKSTQTTPITSPVRALTSDHSRTRSMSTVSLKWLPEMIPVSSINQILDPTETPGPKKITCLTIGTRGDVQPFIALCKRLIEQGHHCRIATHAEYQKWIESHGIEFKQVAGNPAELMQLCVDNGMFSLSFIREATGKFRSWIDELLTSAFEACQGSDVLIESPVAMAGFHIAEKLKIPYLAAFTMPWTYTRNFPHPFAVSESVFGTSYNAMTWSLISNIYWKGTQPQINKWRKTLGLEPLEFYNNKQMVPIIYCFSRSIVPPPVDWHDMINITGYWFLDNPDKNWKPSPELLEFLDLDADANPKNLNGVSKRPIIYIGFGSIIVPDPRALTQSIINAVELSGVKAIISKGWSGRSQSEDKQEKQAVQKEGLTSPNIYMLKSVPHDWLFPHLSGVVHHGGSGTTAAGLRAGVPTIIKPFFGDQYFWGSRISEMGVGVVVPILEVKALSAAFKKITTDETIIAKAKLIGEKIRSEDGPGTAIQHIYRAISYFNDTLTKPLRADSTSLVSLLSPIENSNKTTKISNSNLASRAMQSEPKNYTKNLSGNQGRKSIVKSSELQP